MFMPEVRPRRIVLRKGYLVADRKVNKLGEGMQAKHEHDPSSMRLDSPDGVPGAQQSRFCLLPLLKVEWFV